MVTAKPVLKPKLKLKTKQELLETPQPDSKFQAIGVLYAEVELNEGKASVLIDGKSYRLGYAMEDQGEGVHRLASDAINRRTFWALKREIVRTGTKQRLIVYPRVLHLPGRDVPHQLSFNLLGFEGKKLTECPVTASLQDFEFKLCGLWQHIPVCSHPVITVLKNFSDDRRSLIKSLSATDKQRCLKPLHVPISWDNPVVRPFRFNPRLNKEAQGQPRFVEITAKFLPDKDIFEFASLLSLPSEHAPRFLKIGREDKAKALSKK